MVEISQQYRNLGLGAGRVGFGKKFAVLVVDAQEAFVGSGPLSCGQAGEAVQDAIKTLLKTARASGVTVIYTRNLEPPEGFDAGVWKLKIPAGADLVDGKPTAEIASSISPEDGDVVINKMRPSAFFATNLHSLLRGAGVDTLIVCGATTSGCVRATVVDALSHDYRVVVPEECVCDRIDVSHRVSLEDIDAKYGDVMGLQEVIDNLKNK